MSQNFTPSTPALNAPLASQVIRDNFEALATSNAGSPAPAYGVPGMWFYDTTTRIMQLYGVSGFTPIFKLDVTGILEEVFDPRTLELFATASGGPVSSVIRSPAGVGPVQSMVITLLGGIAKTVTIARTNGLVSSVTLNIPALSFSRVITIQRLSNGLFNGTV